MTKKEYGNAFTELNQSINLAVFKQAKAKRTWWRRSNRHWRDYQARIRYAVNRWLRSTSTVSACSSQTLLLRDVLLSSQLWNNNKTPRNFLEGLNNRKDNLTFGGCLFRLPRISRELCSIAFNIHIESSWTFWKSGMVITSPVSAAVRPAPNFGTNSE